MKLKYYLRGLGIGIIITTIVLMISFSMRKNSVSDEEIIARATQLGMIMPEEDTSAVSESTETTPVNTEENRESGEEIEPQVSGTEETFPGGNGAEMPDAGITGNENTTFRLTIRSGDVCRNVCETLASNGVVDDAESLRAYLFEIGYASSMRTGDYDIPYELSHEEIAKILQAGPQEQ